MTKLTLLLLLLTLISCNTKMDGTALESKIIGGSQVNASNWISVVKLDLSSWGGSCTGTFIDKRTILTAAHCVNEFNPKKMSIRVKNPKNLFLSKTYYVADARVHPMYNGNTRMQNFDVAYITVTEDFTETDGEFIPLLTQEELENLPSITDITMVGFGKTENGPGGKKLVTSTPISAITNTEVIAGDAESNTCQGDSGGPAFVRIASGQYRQMGITSRGQEGCRGAGIYELTTANISWLQSDKKLIQGIALIKQKKYSEAISIINEAIKIFPYNPASYLYIAEAAKILGETEVMEQYAQAAQHITQLLQSRVTDYYLQLLNFETLIPKNGINYACDSEISVDSSPFTNGEAFFYLNVGCGEEVRLKVTFNNLYQDLKDENVDYIYYYQKVAHRMKIHFPEEDIPESAWPVISKVFRCKASSSCPDSVDAKLSFAGYNKAFWLYDTYGLDKDQVNIYWYLN